MGKAIHRWSWRFHSMEVFSTSAPMGEIRLAPLTRVENVQLLGISSNVIGKSLGNIAI